MVMLWTIQNDKYSILLLGPANTLVYFIPSLPPQAEGRYSYLSLSRKRFRAFMRACK